MTVVHGTTSTSFLVDFSQQSCMNCGLQWNYHALVRFDFNSKTLTLACLHRQAPVTLSRAPAIEPEPPKAIGRTVLAILRPYQKMIEPRR